MWISLGVSALVSVALAMPFDTRVVYDDDLARNSMLPLAAATFSKNPQHCLTNIFKGTLKRQIEVKCDGFNGDTCSGFTAVLLTQKAIVISFRGTDAVLQLIEELEEAFKAQVPFPAGGNVNLYFYNAFLDVWNGGMKDDFLTLKNQYPGYALWVTGHSLGAAMASLCASYIINVGYFEKNDVKVPYSVRVTHSHDIVPHLPFGNMGYNHHMTEVFFPTDMKVSSTFVVCAADESDSCSAGITTGLTVNDHLHYYEHHVSGWGQAGCTGNKMEKNVEEEKNNELNVQRLVEAFRRKVHHKVPLV